MSQRTIVVIKASGVREEFSMPKMPSVSELQGWVGGYFAETKVHFEGKSCYMFLNEDGIRLNLPRNEEASRLHPSGRILGDVAILTYR